MGKKEKAEKPEGRPPFAWTEETEEVIDGLDLSTGDVGFDFGALDLGAFDLNISSGLAIESRIIKPPYHRQMVDRMICEENASALVAKIKPERGMRVHCIVSGNFIFSHFLRAFLMDNMIRAKRVTISTLSMSQSCIEAMKDICDLGYCENLDMIVSMYFYSHERRSLIPYLYEALDYDDAPFKFQLAVADTHCKTIQIETTGGAKVVIHGSANLRSSGCVEQFCIEENPELHDFHNEAADKILRTYFTIDRGVRGNKLWEAISGKRIERQYKRQQDQQEDADERARAPVPSAGLR
jgi:hypothetical protein